MNNIDFRLKIRGNSAVIYSDALLKGAASFSDIQSKVQELFGSSCSPSIEVCGNFANLTFSRDELSHAVCSFSSRKNITLEDCPCDIKYMRCVILRKIDILRELEVKNVTSDVSRETYLKGRKTSKNDEPSKSIECLLTILLFIYIKNDSIDKYVCEAIKRGFQIANSKSIVELTNDEIFVLSTISKFQILAKS